MTHSGHTGARAPDQHVARMMGEAIDRSTRIHVEDAADLDYATAGHFIRWLLEEHDPALILPILEGAAFEPTYDLPFPEAAALFEGERTLCLRRSCASASPQGMAFTSPCSS